MQFPTAKLQRGS